MNKIYTSDNVEIRENPSREIFIENKVTGKTLRIYCTAIDIEIIATNSIFVPTHFNGEPGFIIK